jgi:hypothetical protein
MTTTSRPQPRHDHRLRDLVQRTGDLTIATDFGVPRSTARGGSARRGRVSPVASGPPVPACVAEWAYYRAALDAENGMLAIRLGGFGGT